MAASIQAPGRTVCDFFHSARPIFGYLWGQPTSSSPPKQWEAGGEACWLWWPGVITPLIVLGVSGSVFPHQWLNEWPWANRLLLLSPVFSSTEQKLMWRSKDVMTEKAVEKNKRDSYFLHPVGATHTNLKKDYPVLKLPKPWIHYCLPLPAIFGEKASW